ncbi:hypothetical protein FPQ18DRAFT_307892 [Pyronema domesticum]|nr:hypothetical protein FPQ18DRAFT_307892 [Pyronema domesticum]
MSRRWRTHSTIIAPTMRSAVPFVPSQNNIRAPNILSTPTLLCANDVAQLLLAIPKLTTNTATNVRCLHYQSASSVVVTYGMENHLQGQNGGSMYGQQPDGQNNYGDGNVHPQGQNFVNHQHDDPRGIPEHHQHGLNAYHSWAADGYRYASNDSSISLAAQNQYYPQTNGITPLLCRCLRMPLLYCSGFVTTPASSGCFSSLPD